MQALGITLSPRQAELAREKIRLEGLDERCRVEILDYRALAEEQHFDKIVSVGMVEHVGRSQIRSYLAKLFRLLKPGGLLLNHGITTQPLALQRERSGVAGAVLWREGSFIARCIFPDAELLPLGEIVHESERAGFETADVETLRRQ